MTGSPRKNADDFESPNLNDGDSPFPIPSSPLPINKRIIGLTGGIATGKSTVANYLANAHRLQIFDADVYARDAVSVGSPILAEIAKRYGGEILLPNGELNRQKLGERIFPHPDERLWLENLIHPYVQERFLQEIAATNETTIVLVVPLLFEAKMTDLVTEVWVVSCDEKQQLTRLMQRNNLTLSQAQARINSQMPLAEKIARADVVLDNSTTLENLQQHIDACF